jgi:uncharacterized protein
MHPRIKFPDLAVYTTISRFVFCHRSCTRSEFQLRRGHPLGTIKPLGTENVKLAGVLLFKKLVLFTMLLLSVGLLTTGCQTYQQKNKVIVYWRAGDFTRAETEATKRADDNANNKDAIIWRLEQGTALRALGKYQESNKAFDQAQEKMDEYVQKAKVRLGQETAALFSNQANLAYEGRPYDGIMLNTYEALNYLALGEPEKARPELIRAYQRQQDAVEDNQRQIEKAQQAVNQSKDKVYIERAEQNPGFQAEVQKSLAPINNLQVYANYVNPFTVYLDGLFFMADATGPSDLERAHKSFERVEGFNGNNDDIRRNLAMVDDRMNGQPLPPTTYVIFETGCAPVRDQIRIDIPIIVYEVSYVGAAFPILRLQGDFLRGLTVTANGTNYQTRLVASMDSIIALDYRNELPVVIIKTVAATVTKAVAAYFANAAVNRQNNIGGFLMQLATAAYQMSVNIADTRTWTTLPKEFQACCFPTPPDGKIELLTPTGTRVVVSLALANSVENELTPANRTQTFKNSGSVLNVVYVKSVTAGTPLLVSQFRLK